LLTYNRAMAPQSPLVKSLDAALKERQIAEGFALLKSYNSRITGIEPTDPDAAGIVVRLAQWVDLGYRDVEFLDELVKRFPPERCARMRLQEFLQLRMAEAFCAMGYEDLDRAIELLDFVLKAERELRDQRLAAIAHFWQGRSHRKKGEYDEAMRHVVRGRELMQAIGAPKLAAVIQIQESWLLFQQGHSAEALRLLNQAKAQLVDTDDALSLGNIESAKGRIERQAGKYTEALAHFDMAVELYARRDPDHRNLARALVNVASVKRLVALQLRKRIDARAKTSRPARHKTESPTRGAAGALVRYSQICREALQQLQRAGEIYSLHHYYSGIASVLVSTGYLHLDSGNIELGSQEALKAYELAHDKNDHIHMARARTLQCIAENARIDEQLGEDADAAVYANQARIHSEEAVHWAELTQNRRLAAEAYVARGMMFANDFFQEWEEAKRCVDHASALLGPEDRDHLWEDLMALKIRILRASSIDETLRAWSEGILGDKTFQQVTEEFAEIVIPKVWQREGKKIAKVSSRLSMSPKKVRRILRNVGLLKWDERG
jgi:tetratricopeptide (TPR) repeat protein